MDVQSVPSSGLSVAPSSISIQSGGRLSGSLQMGAGQDFVLFDDAGNASGLASISSPQKNNSSYNQSSSSPVKMNNRPPFTSTPSFTEHRGHQSGIQMESPFSSPASKPEDDFGVSTMTSEAYNNGNLESGYSGTLAHGTPKSKRQRGHGYSSSWTGGNLQQHRQIQNKYSSGSTLANAMAPTQSFGGYSGSTSKKSEYSGSDTSPQNPPSGNFGPPIQSLSLGEGSDGSFPSLFPTSTIPVTSLSNSVSSSTLDGALPFSSSTPKFKQQRGQSSLHNFTQEQKDQQEINERARQQIRAELMGVDSRALKGPLRDIQQGTSQDDNQQALLSNLSFNTFQPSNFFNDLEQQQSGNSTFDRPGCLIRQRSGSLDENFLSSNVNSFNTGSSWSGLPTNDFNAFDLQGLDGYRAQIPFTLTQQQQNATPQFESQNRYNSNNYSNTSSPSFITTSSRTDKARPELRGPQFSARTQQAVDRARAQKPTRKRIIRDESGLTVSPQDAFLDYNNIESLLQQSSSQPQMMPTNDQNLFNPPPLGLQEMLSSSESSVLTPKANSSFESSSFPTNFGPSSVISATTQEGTPSLIDANSSSSSNGSRATSMISSPLQRMPLNREDTVRPKKQQMNDSTSQQSISTGDLFSPSYSTSSSTDDEDEKPYKTDLRGETNRPRRYGAPSNDQLGDKWQFPFPSQASKDQVSSMTHGIHSGPRFSVVSSSSSESDDDDQRGRKSQIKSAYDPHGRRSMGGYGYMGSSQESGMSVTNPYFKPTKTQSMQTPSLPSSQESSSSPVYPGGIPSQRGMLPSSNQNDNQTPQSAGGQSDNQSQDEGPKLSPSIRTSAQAIVPIDSSRNNTGSHYNYQTNNNTQGSIISTARSQSRNRSQAQAAAISAASIAAANPNQSSSEKGNSSIESNSEWETGEESEADGSDYQDDRKGGNTNKKTLSSGTRKRRRDGGIASSGTRNGGTTKSGATSSSITSSSSHLTVCDYISPLTGEACRTEFHRPYDLARHRETIHAREEALLVKQGRLRKEQCVVLYREVDPAKSLATVEWKCEGKNGCGSLFSRKDALLRHKRIRGH